VYTEGDEMDSNRESDFKEKRFVDIDILKGRLIFFFLDVSD